MSRQRPSLEIFLVRKAVDAGRLPALFLDDVERYGAALQALRADGLIDRAGAPTPLGMRYVERLDKGRRRSLERKGRLC